MTLQVTITTYNERTHAKVQPDINSKVKRGHPSALQYLPGSLLLSGVLLQTKGADGKLQYQNGKQTDFP
jgi:hypothetical protein